MMPRAFSLSTTIVSAKFDAVFTLNIIKKADAFFVVKSRVQNTKFIDSDGYPRALRRGIVVKLRALLFRTFLFNN